MDLILWHMLKLTHQRAASTGGRVWYLRLPCYVWCKNPASMSVDADIQREHAY